jgi:hypothetical protein
MRTDQIAEEFRGADLGDRRRAHRLERIGVTLSREPGSSFPEAMASEGQLEALYRFLNNDDVDFGEIHAVHAARTAERCREGGQVLVLHEVANGRSGRASAKASAAASRGNVDW